MKLKGVNIIEIEVEQSQSLSMADKQLVDSEIKRASYDMKKN